MEWIRIDPNKLFIWILSLSEYNELQCLEVAYVQKNASLSKTLTEGEIQNFAFEIWTAFIAIWNTVLVAICSFCLKYFVYG